MFSFRKFVQLISLYPKSFCRLSARPSCSSLNFESQLLYLSPHFLDTHKILCFSALVFTRMCWTLSCVTTLVMVLLVWAVIMVPSLRSADRHAVLGWCWSQAVMSTDWAWQAVTSRQGHTARAPSYQPPDNWRLSESTVLHGPYPIRYWLRLGTERDSAESGWPLTTHWSLAQCSARSSLFALWLWSVVTVSSCPRFLFSRPPDTRHCRPRPPRPCLVSPAPIAWVETGRVSGCTSWHSCTSWQHLMARSADQPPLTCSFTPSQGRALTIYRKPLSPKKLNVEGFSRKLKLYCTIACTIEVPQWTDIVIENWMNSSMNIHEFKVAVFSSFK